MPDSAVINLWENRCLTDWLSMYALTHADKIHSREQPDEIAITEKTAYTKYPTYSRPVFRDVSFVENTAITGRHYNLQLIRKGTIDPNLTLTRMQKAYFRNDYK